MKYLYYIIVIVLLTLIFGCSSQDDYGRDLEAIAKLLGEHVDAVNTGNVIANLAGFTEDVVYLPPDQPPVRGKSALEQFIQPFYDSFEAEIKMIPEETVVSGDWAFQWGTISGTIKALSGSESSSAHLKYMYVYQRQPDGTWRIARDIYNNNIVP